MRRILSVGCVLVAMFLVGCGNMTKGKAAAAAQVVAFHQHFNETDMDAIVSGVHPDLLKVTSRDKFTNFVGVVRRKLGKATDSQDVNWNMKTFNGVVTVVLIQNTTFEKGKGSETFTFRIQDEKASLLGYNINSQDLIMN